MRIAIVAIFKNEAEYILEWLAYHRKIAGITDFIIADNASNDGTTQLLEALDQAKIIKRIFFPREHENIGPQIPAYNHIIEQYGADFDYFLFIDADEFLVNNTGKSLPLLLQEHSANTNFGGITLNWRIFGSSGNTYKQDGLVIERFYRASKKEEGVNRHVKSFVAPKAVEKMHIHHVELKPGFHCYNENGVPAIFSDNPQGTSPTKAYRPTPFTTEINNSSLYVAHYAVKSKTEHFAKKASRGSAGGQSSREKGRKYFNGHDLNNEICTDLSQYSNDVYLEVQNLKGQLREQTPYYCYSRVNLDHRHERLSGWVSSDFEGELSLGVLIDEMREIELPLNKARKDVFEKGLTNREQCGFNYAWSELGQYNQSIRVWIKSNNLVIYEAQFL